MLGHSHDDNPHGLTQKVLLPLSLVLNTPPGKDLVPGTLPAIGASHTRHAHRDDVLVLKSASYILLAKTQVDNGFIYTYLGPNNHRIHSYLSPTQPPIKCLVSGHKPKMEWTRSDLALRKSNVTSAYITWWMKKNARVRCDTCGHVLRERRGGRPLEWLPQLLVPNYQKHHNAIPNSQKQHNVIPSTPTNSPILSPSPTITA